MAESFTLKSFFSPSLVRRLADSLANVQPRFPAAAFVKDATRGLDALELIDRAKHIGRALKKHLPATYPEAVELLVRSAGPARPTDENLGGGMEPFFYYPHLWFVAEYGLEHFELSMHAQRELTKRFSAEFSIRPFIAREPERTFDVLRGWAKDADAHVRRLVSEGTRLRLPWGMRVAWLDQNPRRILELLELLKDDPSTMVRRSVANNLNDLGKAHPTLLYETAGAWLNGASPERRALVEHALRSAVKRGEPEALALLGFGAHPAVAIEDVRFEPKRVAIGGRVAMTFVVRSTSSRAQELLVDTAVHFVKQSGRAAPKVFKLERITLPPRARAALRTSFSLAVHTTRKPQPGRHAVDVLVNGVSFRAGTFDVTPSAARPRRAHAGARG